MCISVKLLRRLKGLCSLLLAQAKKESAEQVAIAIASSMTYRIIRGSDVAKVVT